MGGHIYSQAIFLLLRSAYKHCLSTSFHTVLALEEQNGIISALLILSSGLDAVRLAYNYRSILVSSFRYISSVTSMAV